MFDIISTINKIEYGVVKGNKKIVYIKVGNNGGIYGYENKYLRIAKQLNGFYDYSVIVASNHLEISLEDNIDVDMIFIKELFPEIEAVYAFGYSKGGQMLATYAYKYQLIKRVVAVNAPLIINMHKTKNGVERFSGEKMIMIYGDKDPSYPYIELLDFFNNDLFKYFIIKNADHNFTNMLEEFINLAKEYLA